MTTAGPTERAQIQRRTIRTLMIGAIPAGLATAGSASAASLLGEDLTGSKTLGGLAGSSMTLGSALATVHLARFMSANGRRPGLALGWSIAFFGSLFALAAAITDFYPILPFGMLGVGVGNAANLAQRYASVDLATEESRARTLGTMVWATTIGAVLGPTIALGGADRMSRHLNLPKLAGPFLLTAALFLIAAWWIRRRLYPDPLVAAGGLEKPDSRRAPLFETIALIAVNPPARLAAGAMLTGHAVMVGIMAMTPLHMKDGNHELRIIGLVISLHVVGMYGLSPVVGWLVDRIGSRIMIALGGGILFLGAELASHTDPQDSLGVFTGLYLIGLGWSFTLISGSSLLTAAFPVSERVRVQGAGDFLMTAAGAMAGLSAGAIADWRSFHDLSHWAGVLGLVLSALAIYTLFRGERYAPSPVAVSP